MELTGVVHAALAGWLDSEWEDASPGGSDT